MNINDMLRDAGTSAMTLLADLQPRHDLIRAGAEPKAVDKTHKLYAVYYGPCASRRKQRDARDNATTNKLGFERLHVIERVVARLHDDTKAWALRRDLTRYNGTDYGFHAYARKKLEHYNRDTKEETPEPSFKVTSHPRTGDASMNLRGDAATIREFEHQIRERATTEDTTTAEAAVATLGDLLNGTTTSTSRPNYTMKVLVWLDDLAAVFNGESSDPTVVTTTGATMTLTQALAKKINPTLEIVGLTPAHGAIGLAYANNPLGGWDNTINTRAQLDAEQARRARAGEPPIPPEAVEKALSRHGTAKDRALLEANQTVCAGLGCSVPAAYCEINHNIPYSQGGLSVLSNMCLLCPYHNGKAGDQELYWASGGVAYRILPGGGLVANDHPLAGLSPPHHRS
ncbi:HNH endonuclease signature motif containing protein [Corynebacterium sp.]|uniref:HNH endonuclease signature motif containing protein n=1 Tax=Corynebacterium sp. TaxID=1720 RepID=UPI0037366BD7